MNVHFAALKALALGVLIASSSGCMLSPYDGMRVPSRTSSIRFNGYDAAPSTVTTVRAYNFTTGAWDAVGNATSGTSGIALFEGVSQLFYSWSTNIVLPTRYWSVATSGVGYYARVRSGTGLNHYSVRRDWASCWTEHRDAPADWLAQCTTHRAPEAYVYTSDYQHGPAGCGGAPTTTKSRYSVTEISSSCQRQAVADLMASYLNRTIITNHYAIDHNVPNDFFYEHREYLGLMERYLSVYGSRWMPDGHIPFWDSATTIPAELRLVKASPQQCGTSQDAGCSTGWNDDPLTNASPNIPKPGSLAPGAVCSFSTLTALHHGTHPWHGSVHPAVGGTMGTFDSPAAVIFWSWHTYVDMMFADWLACP